MSDKEEYTFTLNGTEIPVRGRKDENGALVISSEDWDEMNEKVREVLAPNTMGIRDFLGLITNEGGEG